MDETNKNNNPNNNPNEPNKKSNAALFFIYGSIILAIILLQFVSFTGKPEHIGWGELARLLKERHIQRIVVVNREYAEIYLKPEYINSNSELKSYLEKRNIPIDGPHYIYNISSPEVFHEQLEKAQEDIPEDQRIYYESEVRHNYWDEILSWFLPLIFLVIIWMIIFRRMGAGGSGNIFNVGKAKAKLIDPDKVKVTFKDVAGLEEAKQEISEIVDFLKNPSKYTKLGGKIPKGVLLVGPPGTGKTLLAKAVAGEAKVPFFSLSGSDFVEMFVGVGASRVRDLFARAKAKAPCIIFIDEIDAIGRSRSTRISFSSNDERENTLNALLTEMDGFDSGTGVIILAATNRPEILDKALLRAGRFDRQITLELPDLRERKEIFKVHIRNLKLAGDIDLDLLAKQTPGFSGADIANVCNEAALIAARKNKEAIDMEDFHDAIDKIVGGLEKKHKIIKPDEKKRIAYHEAGHATVSWMLKYAQPLIKVSIIPRGRSLGAAWYMPEERQLSTKEQLFDEICALLGGRAAEEIIFSNVSSGALNDLERATKQAFAMVAFFGMSEKIGNISFFDSTGQRDYTFQKPYSEKTSEIIDEEVKKIVETQYARAKEIIFANKEKFVKLAEKLLEKEILYTDDVEEILGKREFSDDVKDVIEGIKQLKKKDKKKDEENQENQSNNQQEQNNPEN